MTTEKIFKWSILAYSVFSYGFVFGVFMMDKPKKDQLIYALIVLALSPIFSIGVFLFATP